MNESLPDPDLLEALERRVNTVSDEVNALQIASTEKRKPFYQVPSTAISLVALLFSLVTTYLSNERIASQDLQNQRAELRVLLQRIAALPKENVEVMKKYADDQASAINISGYINQENTFLARQAAEVAERLPKDRVSAVEYYAIALALQGTYDIAGATKFASMAVETAKDFNTEITGRRILGNLEFLAGNAAAGREQYGAARRVFEKYPVRDQSMVAQTHVLTELNWAGSEFIAGLSDEMRRHVEEAEQIAAGVPWGPGRQNMQAQVAQARSMWEGAVPAAGAPSIAGTTPSGLVGSVPVAPAGVVPGR